MDTVHKEAVRQILVEKHPDKTILSSPQGIGGDDRCGVWMICKILDSGKYRPHVIFCEDEESGCIGAGKFAKSPYPKKMEDVKFIVEVDRRNAKDAVYYECDNPEFEAFITETTGYKTAEGSYSDICELAPAIKAAAVNLSCGYYKEHNLDHYVVWEEMCATQIALERLCVASQTSEKYEYIRAKGAFSYFGSNEYGYACLTFTWVENGKLEVDYSDGCNEYEAIGYFLACHPDLCLNDVSYDVEYF